jgi:hypothetical protein
LESLQLPRWRANCLLSSNPTTYYRKLQSKAGRALGRNGTVHRDKNQYGTKWKAAHCVGPARHRPLRHVSEQLRNTGHSKTFRRSEACGRLLPSEGFCVFFCSNWFLTLIGSEAVRGRSPDPSRPEPCRADPIQCAPSLTTHVERRRKHSALVFK